MDEHGSSKSKAAVDIIEKSRLSDNEQRSRSNDDVKSRSRLMAGDGDTQYVDNEKRSAEQFIEELTKFIPDLVGQYSVTDVDEALQQFASTYADSKFIGCNFEHFLSPNLAAFS